LSAYSVITFIRTETKFLVCLNRIKAIGIAIGLGLFVATGMTLMLAQRPVGDLKSRPIGQLINSYLTI